MKTVLSVLAVLLTASLAAAVQLPLRLNFQGKLLDPATGAPKNGTVTMTFSIYSAATGGTALYSETQSNVSVSNGVFSAQIGSVTPLSQELFSGASAYLGITVAPDAEMTPRQYLAMSPYAFTAMQLAQAGDIRINPGVAYSTFSADGNLLVAAGVTAGSATITGALTASSGTFTATGNGQYSLATSSGIHVGAGTLQVDGTGGVNVQNGVTASTFAGDGRYLTNTAASVSNSSAATSVTLTAGTESVAISTSIALSLPVKNVFIAGTVSINRLVNSAGACQVRVRRSTAGPGTCTSASTLIYNIAVNFPNTSGLQTYVPVFGVDSPGTTSNTEYCLGVVCTAAHGYSTRSLQVMAAAP